MEKELLGEEQRGLIFVSVLTYIIVISYYGFRVVGHEVGMGSLLASFFVTTIVMLVLDGLIDTIKEGEISVREEIGDGIRVIEDYGMMGGLFFIITYSLIYRWVINLFESNIGLISVICVMMMLMFPMVIVAIIVNSLGKSTE